ncbi:hypothetical protein DT019_38080 [Streptomyces sp. SDr-06]|uniref:hypothetical protein n=1 Tax=Streptomyces sp. SDr-06 TaxID=2267702 RepID=UPI000DE83A19|nr:hypothetical protein [Streptomyces sp. SDr-06]RCH59722.1 hypothetical protein DT019_38080 [Streptomyces sp. SDr-06]
MMAFGELLTLAMLGMALAGLTGAVLGIYALTCNRVPGRWFARMVRNPRLWGIGVLFMTAGFAYVSVLGLGIMVTAHTVRLTR